MKELISLPSGSKPKQVITKDMPDLPGGSKGKPFYVREDISLPPQSDNEVLSAGINGLVDPLSPVSRPLGYLSSVKNLTRSGKTGAQTRPGRVLVGNQVGATRVLGFASLYPAAGTKKLVSGSGTVWKVYNSAGSGSWDNLLTGRTNNARFVGASIDDLLILTNGEDAVQKYDGTTIEDLGGGPPESPFIAVAYRRIFLVDLPHQVVVCNTADIENWITEDSASLSISAKDGDTITWIQFYKMNLYIWKRHSLHELHGPELGYVTKNWRDFRLYKVGTPNGRTVVETGGTLYWLSDSENYKGIVAWTGGNQPVLISDRSDAPGIKGIINRINWDYISTASAGTDGNGNYLLSVPLDAATTPTATIAYCIVDGSWWMWEIGTPTVYGSYRLSEDTETFLMGDNSGYVYSLGGPDDAGTPIEYEAVIGPAILGNPTQLKRVRRAYIVAAGGEDERFTLGLGGATGGTFTLGNGKTNTAGLAHNAAAATIQTALAGIYGAGNVTVAAAGADFNILFNVQVGASNLEADFALLTGTTGTPALTQTPQEMQAATSAADIGPFDDPVTIEFTNTQVQRIKKFLPLNAADPMGGYTYRLKLSGTGAVKLFEVGFEVGARRV